ncbi:Flp family type IVb pilin [Solimonas variicoloris]|uniref:Flp family type IVb pilin n=1 Tax=Solimonas variicoloris TaxID=254408 RepID=UPI00036475EC|nr:Flp family type IVb pilin [Solimonas variicoloris]
MLNKMMNFLRDEEGASAVEYGLIVGLIAIAIVVILGTTGTSLKDLFTIVEGKIPKAAG